MLDEKEINKVLVSVRKSITTNKNKIEIVITAVIKEFDNQFKKTDLFKKDIRGDVVIARNMIFVLIKKTTTLSSKEISSYMENVSQFTINNIMFAYNKLDAGNKFDKKVIDRHEKVLTIILNK